MSHLDHDSWVLNVTQIGNQNRVNVTQIGNQNRVNVTQIGNQNRVNVTQIGNRNRVNVTQIGNQNRVNVTKIGNRNRVNVTQIGNRNRVKIFSNYSKLYSFINIVCKMIEMVVCHSLPALRSLIVKRCHCCEEYKIKHMQDVRTFPVQL